MTSLTISLLVFVIGILKIVLVGAVIAGTMVAANKYIFGEEKFDLDIFTKKQKVTVTCASCKATIDPAHKFCPYCGTSTAAVAEETKEAAQPTA